VKPDHAKILVTGADGFIGSHLVEGLVSSGYNVRAMAVYNSHNSWGWLEDLPSAILQNVEVIAGDIRDPFAVDRIVSGCTHVMHLASLIAIPYSYQAPASYIETNINGTLNILQAALSHNVARVVCTSTSEVYGTAQFVPITEQHPMNAQSPYAATKIAADQLAMAFHKSFDLPVSVLRPFNTYGPRQSARAVIPTIISQIASGKTKIKLGARTPTRDFTMVTDTAHGFIQIASCDDAVGKVVNIGSGFEISIGDLAFLIGNVMKVDIEIVTDAERVRGKASEVERLLADTEMAKSLFDWAPKYGGIEGFETGLKETVRWFSDVKNLNLFKSDIYNV
jgi:dTDP-glucose 4,6-dehydratase